MFPEGFSLQVTVYFSHKFGGSYHPKCCPTPQKCPGTKQLRKLQNSLRSPPFYQRLSPSPPLSSYAKHARLRLRHIRLPFSCVSGFLDRRDHAVPNDRSIEGKTQPGAFLHIAGQSYIELGDVEGEPGRRLGWYPAVFLRNGQRGQSRIFTLPALQRQLQHLHVTASPGDHQIPIRAINLPQQVCPPRLTAPEVKRRNCAALQRTMHRHLVGRGSWQALVGLGDFDQWPTGGKRRAQLCELAETVTHRIEKMAGRNRQ